MKKQQIIHIYGRVQGVYYRAHTKKKADKLGVIGYVKNLDDGSVEIGVEGTNDQLNRLTSWCHQGSPFSNVSEVKVSDAEQLELSEGFEITY